LDLRLGLEGVGRDWRQRVKGFPGREEKEALGQRWTSQGKIVEGGQRGRAQSPSPKLALGLSWEVRKPGQTLSSQCNPDSWKPDRQWVDLI
jgi:hypothetical protein